jgi:hypothetical protein
MRQCIRGRRGEDTTQAPYVTFLPDLFFFWIPISVHGAFWFLLFRLLHNPRTIPSIERRARADTQTHTGALPVASLTVVRSAVRESRPCGWRSFHVCTRVSVCMGHDTGDVRETTNKLRPPPRPTSRRLVPILRSLLSPPRARAGDVSRPGVSAQPSLKPTTWARSARR